MNISAMAVFCGSKKGNNPLFIQEAVALGHLLASHSITLIYGGGNKGMMGAVANAVLEKKGRVTGIIPQLLSDREHQHNGLTELIVVDDMHIRKRMLYEKCDAAVILPGGYGTLDELFEMLTWNQLNIHYKKIFILNTAGFYDHLVAHNQKMRDEDFLYEEPGKRMTIVDTVAELEDILS